MRGEGRARVGAVGDHGVDHVPGPPGREQRAGELDVPDRDGLRAVTEIEHADHRARAVARDLAVVRVRALPAGRARRGVDDGAVALDEELADRAREARHRDLLRIQRIEDAERAVRCKIHVPTVRLDDVGLVHGGDLVVRAGVRRRAVLPLHRGIVAIDGPRLGSGRGGHGHGPRLRRCELAPGTSAAPRARPWRPAVRLRGAPLLEGRIDRNPHLGELRLDVDLRLLAGLGHEAGRGEVGLRRLPGHRLRDPEDRSHGPDREGGGRPGDRRGRLHRRRAADEEKTEAGTSDPEHGYFLRTTAGNDPGKAQRRFFLGGSAASSSISAIARVSSTPTGCSRNEPLTAPAS